MRLIQKINLLSLSVVLLFASCRKGGLENKEIPSSESGTKLYAAAVPEVSLMPKVKSNNIADSLYKSLDKSIQTFNIKAVYF